MPIHERVQEDLKTAMKAGDKVRLNALRNIRKELIEIEKAGTGGVTDDKATDALRKLRKQRVEAADLYRKGNRPELAADEEAEIGVIDGYLPKPVDPAEVRAWVVEAIAATGATNAREAGKVVGTVMKLHKGKVEASDVKRIAEEILPK
jgi:uncharacterized protein YqeY